MEKKLNIVLVHGAWGDGSHWKHVIPSLHAKGYTVRAVQIPLTSVADDVQTTKNLVASLTGPILLVGHSYGGFVISAVGNEPNVVGLVYIAALRPRRRRKLRRLIKRKALRLPVPLLSNPMHRAFCGWIMTSTPKTSARVCPQKMRW